MDIRSQINHLVENTKLTSTEIIKELGITYGKFYSVVNRTTVENRDAQIMVYDRVGHDGSKPEDRCIMCGIIMLKDYSETPEGWGEFQRSRGHICTACVEDMLVIFPQAMQALITSECAYCGSKNTEIFFYDYLEDEIPLPQCAVALCKQHRRKFYENEKDRVLRDFYNRIDNDKLFAITGWKGGTDPSPWMPVWDDMLLVDAGGQCCICNLSDGDCSCPGGPERILTGVYECD